MFLKPYDSRSHNQIVRMMSCLPSLLDASSARHKSCIPQSIKNRTILMRLNKKKNKIPVACPLELWKNPVQQVKFSSYSHNIRPV